MCIVYLPNILCLVCVETMFNDSQKEKIVCVYNSVFLFFFLLRNIRVKYLHRMFAKVVSLGRSFGFFLLFFHFKRKRKKKWKELFILTPMIGKVNIFCIRKICAESMLSDSNFINIFPLLLTEFINIEWHFSIAWMWYSLLSMVFTNHFFPCFHLNRLRIASSWL